MIKTVFLNKSIAIITGDEPAKQEDRGENDTDFRFILQEGVSNLIHIWFESAHKQSLWKEKSNNTVMIISWEWSI